MIVASPKMERAGEEGGGIKLVEKSRELRGRASEERK